eukprot:901762_1
MLMKHLFICAILRFYQFIQNSIYINKTIPMPAAWLSGAVAGGVHAVSGPDHLAALIPLCMGKGLEAFKEGAIWGLGHGLGCSIMGFIGVLFKKFINIHLVSEYMEFVVGFTLILLGFL